VAAYINGEHRVKACYMPRSLCQASEPTDEYNMPVCNTWPMQHYSHGHMVSPSPGWHHLPWLSHYIKLNSWS